MITADTLTDFELSLPQSSTQLLSQVEVGLVLPTFNRYDYLCKCTESLAQGHYEHVALVIVDDASDDPNTQRLVAEFELPGVPIFRARRRLKEGFLVHENLRFGWDLLCQHTSCSQLCVLDSDTIVRAHWLEQLHTHYPALQERYGSVILSGFNAIEHPAIHNERDHCLKRSVGGCNLYFSRDIYEDWLRSILVEHWDWRMVEQTQEREVSIACLRPSVVQHIGQHGIWSGGLANFDFATDYFLGANSAATLLGYLVRALRKLPGISRR